MPEATPKVWNSAIFGTYFWATRMTVTAIALALGKYQYDHRYSKHDDERMRHQANEFKEIQSHDTGSVAADDAQKL